MNPKPESPSAAPQASKAGEEAVALRAKPSGASKALRPTPQKNPTPRPWEMYACHIYSDGKNGGNVCSMSDPRALTIVGYSEVYYGSDGLHEAYANADLICRAVNSHDDLLAACKKAELELRRAVYNEESHHLRIAREIAKVIAKAESSEM